jgi:DNA-binding protein HU-beta
LTFLKQYTRFESRAETTEPTDRKNTPHAARCATRLSLKSFGAADITLQKMTKTELQVALAQATQTNKKTAGAFLDTLGTLAYKEIKKNGEFVLPGFGKLVKQKRKARTGFNPKTQQKIRIPAKTVLKFRVAKVAKDTVLGAKK